MLTHAIQISEESIYIQYRTTGSVCNLTRMIFKMKVFTPLIKELLYAGDCDLLSHPETGLRSLGSAFYSVCDDFGLAIKLRKKKL